jgi:ketosteroid isomerase-like protein/quercetin dioxygenase-like cupin family protein
MRSRCTQTGGIAILALAAACAPAIVGNPQDVENTIRAKSAAAASAVANRNVEPVVVAYAPDAVIIMPNTPAMTGPEGVRRAWTEFFALPNSRMTWQTTAVDVASSGDLATEYGTYQASFDSPGGPVTDRGSYVTVWRRIGNDWFIVRDIATSTQPMPQPVSMTLLFDTTPAEMLAPAGITWRPFSPAGFPPGAQMTVIHGDQTKETDYVLRVRFPDGYRVPQHWHTKAEHVTVLSGEFNLGMGRDPNGPTTAHAPGSFLYMPARTPHFAWTRGETIVQLHGIGPFALNLGVPPS